MLEVDIAEPNLAALPADVSVGAPVIDSLQLISFTIGQQTYGVDILAVREIRAWSETTPLPNTPEFIRGVINLRGTILPILDLRAKFGQGLTSATPTHVVIIATIGARLLGLLVDAVSDILTVAESDIQPVPDGGAQADNEFLAGLITVEDGLVTMIDLDQLASRLSHE